MREMNASDFKAKCLALLDEIAATGEGMTILKRGKPVAQVIPAQRKDERDPQARLKGTLHIHGDIVGPVLEADAWEAEAPNQ